MLATYFTEARVPERMYDFGSKPSATCFIRVMFRRASMLPELEEPPVLPIE